MSQSIQIDVLYGAFTVTATAPATYDEGDKLVGKVGGVLDGFIADCSARNYLPRLYATISEKIEKDFPVPNSSKTTKKKNAEGVEVDVAIPVTPIVHIEKYREQATEEQQKALGELFISTAASLPFYAERQSGGLGKVSEAAMNAANELFTQGADKVAGVVAQIETLVPGYKVVLVDGAATPESLARGIQAVQKKIADDAKKQANSMLGLGA